MKRLTILFILLNIIVMFSLCGCNSPENKSQTTEKKISRKEQRKAKIAQHLEETRKLLTIAQSGTDDAITYVRLTPVNNYLDPLPDGLFFTRDFTSGPGTGKFMGSNMEFEFTSGNCKDAENPPDDGRKKRRWFRKKLNPCKEKVLENEWCARLKDDHSVSYTIYFLSWSIKNKECVGDCEEHDNMTSYVRVKTPVDK